MFEGFHAFDPGEIRSAQLLDPERHHDHRAVVRTTSVTVYHTNVRHFKFLHYEVVY